MPVIPSSGNDWNILCWVCTFTTTCWRKQSQPPERFVI